MSKSFDRLPAYSERTSTGSVGMNTGDGNPRRRSGNNNTTAASTSLAKQRTTASQAGVAAAKAGRQSLEKKLPSIADDEPSLLQLQQHHGSSTALKGLTAHVQQLRGYKNVENPEDDYDDEFFWGSSDDEDHASDKPVVFGHFRSTADLVQTLGDEKPQKKRRPFRTANSDDDRSSDAGGAGANPAAPAAAATTAANADGSDSADSGYDNVERALQSVGIAELLAKHNGKAVVKNDDDVTSSSEKEAIQLERERDETDNNDDDDEDDNDSSGSLAPAHVAARKARSARHALSQDSSDSSGSFDGTTDDTGDWLEAESERTLVEASKALGVARVYPPRIAVTQMSSFHVDYAAVSALDETRIHVRPLVTRVPFEPVSFSDVPVPRFFEVPSKSLAGTLIVPPAYVVSHFTNSSAVHVRDLLASPQHSERWLVGHAAPIAHIAAVGGMIVALLADDTLLMHDVHGAATNEWTIDLKCGALLRSDARAGGSSRSTRCLLVSDACLVIVADARFFMWTWRSLLYVGTSVENVPAPSISFALDAADEKLLPRSDFCALDLRGHVLLGGNQGFVLYDIASEAPLFRYELSAAFAISSFHAVRWSGECVVTLEAAGARIWRVFPLAGKRELGGGTASESGVAPRVAAVTARSPPALIAPDENTTFCSVYADADIVLLGDSLGRVRVIPLTSGHQSESSVAKKTRNVSSSKRASAKLSALTTTVEGTAAAAKAMATAKKAVNDDDDDDFDDDDDDDDDSESESDHFGSDPGNGASGDEGRVALDPSGAQLTPQELSDRLNIVLARVQKQGAAGLKQTLREGVDVWSLVSVDGQTLLHHAATLGLVDVVQLILKKAPSRTEYVARKDENGSTALHAAATAGHVTAVEELIRRGRMSLLDATTRDGMTPLHLIARISWNKVTMPRLLALVHKRAAGKIDVRNKAQETPLHQACLRGDLEMGRWLIDVGAAMDVQKDTGETPLHLAARRGSLALIRLLIDRGANTHLAASDGRVPRDVADGLCSEALARAMGESELQKGDSAPTIRGSVDETTSPVVAEESVPEHNSLMSRLLGRSKSGDIGGSLAIVMLGKKGDEAQLRELLRKAAPSVFAARDKHGQSVLHTASFGGHALVVKMLVRHKKCPSDMVQLCDKNGWTPLHAAASIGELSICNELIDQGADLYRPTAAQRGGTTSAHYLARLPWSPETEAVWRRVFAVRIETDVRDAGGRTPLFDAANKNRAATIRFLLTLGADGNARANDGSTALHTAVASNSMDAVQALVAANVELLDADEIGTARSLAHAHGLSEIAELLDGYHHTLYSAASPRSKQLLPPTRRNRARASPSVAAIPHRSVAAVHRAAEYLNVGVPAPTAPSGASSSGSTVGTLRAAEAPTRVTQIGRDGDRVFFSQENGSFSMWSLTKRNARKAVSSVTCGGPVRVFLCKHGQVMLLAPLQREVDDVEVGPSPTTSGALTSSGGRKSVRVLPRHLYEFTAMQWGNDTARATFDSRGRPQTPASTLLSQCEVSLWMRIAVNEKGLPLEFDDKHLLQPWSERGIVASLLAHRCKIAAYMDASLTHVQHLIDHGTVKVPYALLTLNDVSETLGRMRRDHLPLAPRSLRGANDGLQGAGAKDVALPFFMTVNRGGGFVTLYTLWSSGQRMPAPPAVLRAVFTVTAAMRCGTVGPGTGIGKLRGPTKRVLKGAASGVMEPPGPGGLLAGHSSGSAAATASPESAAEESTSASSHLCAMCGSSQLRMCTFEPCQHSVCCASCGLNAATCAKCQARVERIVVHKV